MPDSMDRAAEISEAWLEERLAAKRLPTGPGALLCEGCGAEIPAARRQKMPGATRCVACQEAREAARAR